MIKPGFPGLAASNEAQFPGPAPVRAHRPAVLPALGKKATDHDIRRFAKEAFAEIRDGFRDRLAQAEQENSRVTSDHTETSTVAFSAELFLDGTSKCYGQVFLGQMFGPDSICFSSSRSAGNSANEILTTVDDNGPALSATMSGFSGMNTNIDPKRMTPSEAAEYLWQAFVRPLSWL